MTLRILLPIIFFSTLVSMAGPSSWTGWRGADRDATVLEFQAPEVWPDQLEQVWSINVGNGYATPLVEGGRIYQHARVGTNEVVWCLDADSGSVLWRAETPVPFRPGGGGLQHGAGPKSTPTLADGRVFTLSITGTLMAWSMEDGTQLWQRDFREHMERSHPYWGSSTSPMMEGGRLYVHVGSCETGGALFCLNPETGEDIWVQKEHTNCYSSPVVGEIDGVRQLVEFNHHGVCGVDLVTGEILWESVFPHKGRSQNTPTPVIHDGLVVVGAEDRGVFAVQPKKSGDTWKAERVWEHREASMDMSSPVISEGVVYGFSYFKMGQLFGLDPSSGEMLWKGDAREGENAAFLAIPGHVLSLNDGGELRVLSTSREKANVLRTYDVGESTWTAPALIEDSILIKDGDVLSRWRIR